MRNLLSVILVSLSLILSSCVVHRDITMYSTGYNQPINGYLEGTLFSGTAEVHVTMPDGETLSGRATFYYGEAGQRMCQATLIGASGTKLECTADVDGNTAHGVGECVDNNERHFTWHF